MAAGAAPDVQDAPDAPSARRGPGSGARRRPDATELARRTRLGRIAAPRGPGPVPPRLFPGSPRSGRPAESRPPSRRRPAPPAPGPGTLPRPSRRGRSGKWFPDWGDLGPPTRASLAVPGAPRLSLRGVSPGRSLRAYFPSLSGDRSAALPAVGALRPSPRLGSRPSPGRHGRAGPRAGEGRPGSQPPLTLLSPEAHPGPASSVPAAHGGPCSPGQFVGPPRPAVRRRLPHHTLERHVYSVLFSPPRSHGKILSLPAWEAHT